MFSSKEANYKIERLHKRVLQIIHNGYEFAYEDLLLKDNSVPIHIRNLHFLMIEIYKTIHDENSSFMKEIFIREDTCYNLKSRFRLKVPRVSSTKYGLETLSFRGSQIWNKLPNEIKNISCLSTFKQKIKNWSGSNCKCKICST